MALAWLNGAGKTTTLRMVVGLLKPDAGTIEIFGVNTLADPIAAKQMIAGSPTSRSSMSKLTPIEYLAFIGGLWRMDATKVERQGQELLERLDLWANRDERCELLAWHEAEGGTRRCPAARSEAFDP